MQQLEALLKRMQPAERRRLLTAGIGSSTVSDWKAGRYEPSIAQLKAIALVMKVNFHALCESQAWAMANPEMREFFERQGEKEPQEGPQMKLGDDF